MNLWKCALGWIATMAASASAAPVSTFDDIQFWVGSGANRAALVIDWVEASSVEPALVWGYRWDGAGTAADMFLDVVAADPRLFAKVGIFSFGMAVFGVGYDVDDDGFGLDDATIFGPGGLFVGAASDGVSALDPDDYYAEGFFLGFWHYGSASSSPYDGGAWVSSAVGMSDVVLADGSWHGLTFTSTFDLTQFPENPVAAAIPEAGSWMLLGLASAVGLAFRRVRRSAATACALLFAAAGAQAAHPYAAAVVSYVPGDAFDIANAAPYQTDGSQALGPPTRDTGFGSQVGVFYPAFQASELVVLGPGGSLTVWFDKPVYNNPHNPFGVDLLIFGNAFFTRDADGKAASVVSEPGVVEVSQDGSTWFTIPNVFADGLYPTMGYVDAVYSGFGYSGGTTPTDFTRPVDPSFDPIGKTEAEIVAGYAGSGGGLGVDIGLVGLNWIHYVRVSQPETDAWTTEIDAFVAVSAVPETSSLASAALCVGLLGAASTARLSRRAPTA